MEGVWQWAHPMVAKVARPASVAGVGGAGVGGASMRMKLAKASMSERTAVCGLAVPAEAREKLRVFLGGGVEDAARRLIAFLLEELVGDTHFGTL